MYSGMCSHYPPEREQEMEKLSEIPMGSIHKISLFTAFIPSFIASYEA